MIAFKNNSPKGDIIEEDLIDELGSPKFKVVAEENRKNKHQTIQQNLALILILAYAVIEIILVLYGLRGTDTSFFDRHMERFTILVSLILGYYFGKS